MSSQRLLLWDFYLLLAPPYSPGRNLSLIKSILYTLKHWRRWRAMIINDYGSKPYHLILSLHPRGLLGRSLLEFAPVPRRCLDWLMSFTCGLIMQISHNSCLFWFVCDGHIFVAFLVSFRQLWDINRMEPSNVNSHLYTTIMFTDPIILLTFNIYGEHIGRGGFQNAIFINPPGR